jgi:hypothetical protein
VVCGNAVAVSGVEAAGGPFAFDGGTELCHELGIGRRDCSARRSSVGGDEFFDAGYLLGGEVGESLLLATRLSSTAFSLVAAGAKASIPEANCPSKDRVLGAWKAPPANSEEDGLGRWYSVAAEADPKVSPREPEARCSCSTVSWASRAHFFHAAQVLAAGSSESQSLH